MKISLNLSKTLFATLALASIDLHNLGAMFIRGTRIPQPSKAYRLNSSSFTHNPRLGNGAKYLAIGIAASTAWWLMQENVAADVDTQSNDNPDHEIIMRIFPWYKTRIVGMSNIIADAGLLTFEGFQPGQVTFISDEQALFFIYPAHRSSTDTPVTNLFPSNFLKKLNYLSGDEYLTILQHNSSDEDPLEVDLSPEVKDRLLKYLLHDLEARERDCCDFFQEILFDQSEANRKITVFPIDELELRPGDGVVLFDTSKKPYEPKHYVIALGDRLYVSKFGSGGPILVSDMKAMLNIYDCTVFAKAESRH